MLLQLVKFIGCYHGHADSFLVQAGSGVATLGLPDSPGVPATSTGGRGCRVIWVPACYSSCRALFAIQAKDFVSWGRCIIGVWCLLYRVYNGVLLRMGRPLLLMLPGEGLRA